MCAHRRNIPAIECCALQVISPFLLVSKKRYCGSFYTSLEQTQGSIKHMGLVLKRRDNAPIVKHFYAGVVDILMRHTDTSEFKDWVAENPGADQRQHLVRRAQAFIRAETEKLLNGKFPMENFILSKSLRGEYKNPTAIAHKVLAERANERGTDAFRSSDRVQFLYFTSKDKKELQGDRIETPQYLRDNKLNIDYRHYLTNQIEKPVSQIFAIALESMSGYDPSKHARKRSEKSDKEDERRMRMAAVILFGDLLKAYDAAHSGMRPMTDYFKPVPKKSQSSRGASRSHMDSDLSARTPECNLVPPSPYKPLPDYTGKPSWL
jgi:hypothetical protein